MLSLWHWHQTLQYIGWAWQLWAMFRIRELLRIEFNSSCALILEIFINKYQLYWMLQSWSLSRWKWRTASWNLCWRLWWNLVCKLYWPLLSLRFIQMLPVCIFFFDHSYKLLLLTCYDCSCHIPGQNHNERIKYVKAPNFCLRKNPAKSLLNTSSDRHN